MESMNIDKVSSCVSKLEHSNVCNVQKIILQDAFFKTSEYTPLLGGHRATAEQMGQIARKEVKTAKQRLSRSLTRELIRNNWFRNTARTQNCWKWRDGAVIGSKKRCCGWLSSARGGTNCLRRTIVGVLSASKSFKCAYEITSCTDFF